MWQQSGGREPDVSAVPAMLRRRMSRLTRMTVATALDCCRRSKVSPSEVRIVFASRHGEMEVTTQLLEQMMEGQPVSPMDFSGSVHHTAIGYFSIATQNRRPMRAVAGGAASFCYGYLDAVGMLGEDGGSPVLLLAADDELPAPFKEAASDDSSAYAVALLLAASAPAGKKSVSFELLFGKKDSKKERVAGLPPAIRFLRWYLEGKKPLELQISDRIWRWEK